MNPNCDCGLRPPAGEVILEFLLEVRWAPPGVPGRVW